MKVEKRTISPYERIKNEITREQAEQLLAVQDYNIMMDILEDPCPEEDEMEVSEDE